MRNVQSFVGSVPSNGLGSRTLAGEPSPCVLTFLAQHRNGGCYIDYFLHSHHLNQFVFPKVHHLSPHLLVPRGCCPYSESIQFGEISEVWQSLFLDDVLAMGLNMVKDVSQLEATGVLVPLRVWIGIELRARKFLDALGGMFDYFRLKSGNMNILSETEIL